MDAPTSRHESDRVPGLHSRLVGHQRPLIAWIAQIGAVVVGIVIVIVVLQIVYGQDASHEDLGARLEVLEDEARFQSCLLQFIPEERTPAVVAGCATEPVPD